MALQDADVSTSENSTQPTVTSPLEDVVEAVAKVSLQDEAAADKKTADSPSRPFHVYTRNVLLHLSKSPMVGVPANMPALKDWFGDWNEQVGSKKESDSSATTSTRDRRFRRDADDGDSARASFRSGLSQPSQMGNFRHQSIRTTDRTSDKDLDRERERDLRDREGQERLRNLSDKYDRDRLALSSASNLRNKERDAAPHLSGTSSARLGQTQTAGRRGEGRDTTKRKAGESSDDWRRGAEPSRAGRDDRADLRRDRDTRERPRSRVRESSRSRRDPSTGRRDRDREDRDRARDRDDRRDKDDSSRRDRDDYGRRDWDDGYDRDRERDRYDYGRRTRDRDLDRDADDDPRRWRDDGRRDERMAARREREGRDRERDRDWNRFEDRDRERPSAGDDRDARNRRGGRDRRLGGDDVKDRDDRRDRDKDREAEPAWMETYVPTTSGGGILGGKSSDGELDGIQAWKKGMKEKERKEKGEAGPTDHSKSADTNGNLDKSAAPPANSEMHMDEIQLFKLMMKREAEKKDGEKGQNGLSNHALADAGPPGLSASPSIQSQKSDATSVADSAIIAQRAIDASSKAMFAQAQDGEKPSPHLDMGAIQIGSQGVFSGLSSGAPDSSRPSETSSPALDRSLETSRVVGPRLSQMTSGVSPPTSNFNSMTSIDLPVPSPSTNTFNPPPGSRMLALKSRIPSGSAGGPTGMNQLPPSVISAPHAHSLPPSTSNLPPHLADSIPNEMPFGGVRINAVDSSRGIRSFSPLSNGSQPNLSLEELQAMQLGHMSDGLRRTSGSSAAERAILGLPGEAGSPYGDLSGAQSGGFPPGTPLDPSGSNLPSGVNYAANKGSRFAKFFDSKTRDAPAAGPRLGQQGPNIPPAMSHPSQRESISLSGMGVPRGERTMEDIFAMLQNSAQGHRGSPQIPQSGRMPPGGGQFSQSTLELQLQQQQQLHQQQLAQSRLESLYDSRLDDRNFMPDGLVPGLRPAPPRSRSRESGGMLFNEQIDDPLHFNVQRLTQQRNMEQRFNGPMPSMYNQQAGMLRNGGLPVQQGQFRGPSPITAQNPLQPPAQRLPPGLANLGGRPPHDPSQFIVAGVGLPGGGLHGATPAQQVYNTFHQGGLGFNGSQPLRGPPGPQTPISMGGLGPNNIDLLAANQAQLLGLAQGSLGGNGGGMRGGGAPGGFGPQHGQSHIAMRQQQQIPPHMMPHVMQSHLQQQGIPGGNAQTTQDLMALLMGGHRE